MSHHDRAAEYSALPEEEAIEPGLVIVDAHHHLWVEPPRSHFTPFPGDALRKEIEVSGHNVVGTVYVECGSGYRNDGTAHTKPLGEIAFAEGMRAERVEGPDLCAAIVGYADLRLGSSIGAVLDEALETSPRFRGVRFKTAHDAELGEGYGGQAGNVMASPDFREGARELARRRLTFDAWMFHPQLPDLLDLADALPDLQIVLDHLGGPIGVGSYASDPQATFHEWRSSMARLAERPNITLKIGSLNMAYSGCARKGEGSQAVADAQRHHILTSIELFGPSRCMFESNFPVEREGISYGTLWNAFKRVTANFSESERTELFAGTAVRTYRIKGLDV